MHTTPLLSHHVDLHLPLLQPSEMAPTLLAGAKTLESELEETRSTLEYREC